MKKIKVINIAGQAGAGKDTCAEMIKLELQTYGYRVAIIHYADWIKKIAQVCYHWDGKKDDRGRALLQKLGTEQTRDRIDPNFWVDKVIEVARIIEDDFDYIIIPDLRFPNELQRWAQCGYQQFTVKIVRPNRPKIAKEQTRHKSETTLENVELWPDFDFVINNDGTGAELKEKAISCARKIMCYGTTN